MKIGVLALQGDFAEHLAVLSRLGASAREVRLPEDLQGLDGLIIPGGESTTIGKLATDYKLIEPLREFGKTKPIWGTCAGAIFLSKDARRDQPLLGLMDISVERNAFGRQVESFVADLDVSALSRSSLRAERSSARQSGSEASSAKDSDKTNPPFRAVFIRAPLIEKVSGNAKALVTLPDGRIVAAEEGDLLATSFHPELTSDDRFHRYFLKKVEQK
jgi:5'-phosphate synthase pdxT subunit